MSTLYTQKDANIRKTWFMMSAFLVVIIAIGYIASWYMGNSYILYGVVIFALLMNIISYWFSASIVLSMTGAREITREEFFDLWNAVENLSITAGVPMPKTYVIDDPALNAFATGRDPEHSAIAVTTGLLAVLTKNELEGVIAHELSHIVNRDMLVMTVAVILAGLVALLADLLMRAMFMGDGDRKHPAFLVIAVIGIILAPIAAQLIKLAITRKREYLADASGALLTRYPEGLASALEKISHYSVPMKRANNATAHLFIASPFGNPDKKSFFQRIGGLFETHPPIEERIKALRGLSN